jgi:integrase
MASFEPRGNSIRAIVRVPGGGKKTATFDTQAEADAWAEKMGARKAVGTLLGTTGSGLTNGELFEAYEEVAGKTDTGKWNLLRLRKWQKDPIADKRIGQTVTHDIDEWITRSMAKPSARTGEAISAATVVRELNLMSGAFGWAVKVRKWIPVNPCHGATRPVGFQRSRQSQVKSLQPAQIAAVRQATGFAMDPQLATKTSRVGAAWLLELETGMRSGEILRIRPEHYWRDRRTVWVAAEERGGRKSSRSGRAQVDPSRKVPLTGYAMELLDLLLATMPAQDDGRTVIMMADCGMLKPPYLVGLTDSQRDALWRKAAHQAGLEGYTFHDGKHEACTRMSKFLDVVALSHAIGTKDIRLLRDTYYINDASASAALLPAHLVLDR